MELTLSDSELVITQRVDQVLQQSKYQACLNCGLHYLNACSFCHDDSNEEFAYTFDNSLFTTEIIIDIESQDNIEFTNAGISDYDQEIHAQQIKGLIDKHKLPHEIAIELGFYTQEQLMRYIKYEVDKMKQKKGTVLLDLKSMSSSQSYIQKIEDEIKNLNRKNVQITKTNEPLVKLKQLFCEDKLMEIIYITNQSRDLGKIQSHHILNCICINIDPIQYKNICRLNSGKSIKFEEELPECPNLMKIIINEPNIFVDFNSNVAYISNFEWPLQIQGSGKYVVQCHTMSSQIYQKIHKGVQSESLKLTQYSKI